MGDAATGTNSESDSFMIVKSKDGYYVQGTVGELIDVYKRQEIPLP